MFIKNCFKIDYEKLIVRNEIFWFFFNIRMKIYVCLFKVIYKNDECIIGKIDRLICFCL